MQVAQHAHRGPCHPGERLGVQAAQQRARGGGGGGSAASNREPLQTRNQQSSAGATRQVPIDWFNAPSNDLESRSSELLVTRRMRFSSPVDDAHNVCFYVCQSVCVCHGLPNLAHLVQVRPGREELEPNGRLQSLKALLQQKHVAGQPTYSAQAGAA